MASSDVTARMAEVNTMMDSAVTEANAFLALMKSELDFHVDPLIPPQGWFAPATITVDAEKPERPDIAEIPAVPAEPIPPMPEFDTPFPTEEVLLLPKDLTFNEQEYLSTLLDDVKAWLLAGVSTGGTGLGATVEQEIWDRQSERDLQTYRDAVDRKISEWSSRGFTMPNDVIDARLEELDDKFRMTDLDKSREVAIKQAELAQTNTHFIITNSLTLEGMTLGHHENIMNRALDAAKAVVSAGVEILNAQIRRYNANLDAYKTRAITFTELEKQKLEYFLARINKYKTEVEAHVARVRGLVDVYQADTNVYGAVVSKSKAEGDIRVAQQQMMVRQSENQLETLLEAAKVNLQKLISQSQFKVNATMQGGNVYAHLAAAAASAISAIVQLVDSTNRTGT